MARLTVKLHGEEVSRITLESGMEYIAGRAQDAQIVLNGERGISRQHLKFYERDGVWVCESLSKFVLIQKGTQSVEVLELGEPAVFSVPPYEFYFEPTVAQPAPGEAKPAENLPVFYQPRAGGGEVSDDTSPKLNHEATVAGVTHLVPYFKISYPNTADDEVLKLEGHLWVAGRERSCEIFIDSPHISRKHFELARTKEGYYITDLGSSNGTKVNGQRIPPHEPTRLDSGDEIRVMNVAMWFEIRDTHFSNRMEKLPMPVFDPMLAAPPMPWYPQLEAGQSANLPSTHVDEIPKDWRKIRPHHLKKINWKKHKVRVALVSIILVVLIVGLTPEGKKEDQNRQPSGQSVVFDNLTTEQKASVKDAFNLARNLYVQGKYELCLTELAKVHELLPLYENSKELQSFCEQGKELVHRERDLQRKEAERAAIEQQIVGYIETCKAKLKADSTVDETRMCLADAIELNPEHYMITEMIHTAQMHEEEAKFLAGEAAKQKAAMAKGRAHYARVKSLWKKGKLAKAIDAYEGFIDTPYPKIDSLKSTARRELASIKKEHQTKVDSMLEQCRQLGSKNHYRDAYLACDKAVEEDPSNEPAKELRGQMHSELKREMKAIYEDSVLEESLGNVDSAKEKWKKILKENLDFDDYSVKARSKLRRYGIGT